MLEGRSNMPSQYDLNFSTEDKLKKQHFDEKFRFRVCREQQLVNCASCAFVTGNVADRINGVSYCNNPLRLRRTQIKAKDSDWNGALEMVCDSFQSKPLPANTSTIIFREGEGAVLTSQFADCLHVDSKCPYVVEEQRLFINGGRAKYNRSGEVRIVDVSETVPGAVHKDSCDMPCCESRLQFQICNPNTYRNLVGMHPNARDPRRFVKNAITRHGRNSNMSYEEAEEFFGKVGEIALSVKEKGVHTQIGAVSDYIHRGVNPLGSKPLSEAVNPVWLWGVFELLSVPAYLKKDFSCGSIYDSTGTGAEVWVYDKRLFDFEKESGRPFDELSPEGIIPCVDSKGVFRSVRKEDLGSRMSESFYISGILKPLEDRALTSRGLTHFIDIREVSYHAHEHVWGESGIGFSGTASFHEQ